MKSLGLCLIFLAICFGIAALSQSSKSEMEVLIEQSNDEFRSEMDKADNIGNLIESLGGNKPSYTGSGWDSVAESESNAADIKSSRLTRMWVFVGICAVSFLSGIICLSSKNGSKEEVHNTLETNPVIQSEVPTYLLVKSEEKGPYLMSQISLMWNSGQLTSDTLYKQEDADEWAKLSKLLAKSNNPENN